MKIAIKSTFVVNFKSRLILVLKIRSINQIVAHSMRLNNVLQFVTKICYILRDIYKKVLKRFSTINLPQNIEINISFITKFLLLL